MAVDFASLYTRARTGKAFLIGICLFCGSWAVWNLLPGLPHFDDPALGRLTTILSIEASIAASLILAHNERAEAIDRKQEERHEKLLRYIADMLEAQIVTMKGISNVAPHADPAANPGMDAGNAR